MKIFFKISFNFLQIKKMNNFIPKPPCYDMLKFSKKRKKKELFFFFEFELNVDTSFKSYSPTQTHTQNFEYFDSCSNEISNDSKVQRNFCSIEKKI